MNNIKELRDHLDSFGFFIIDTSSFFSNLNIKELVKLWPTDTGVIFETSKYHECMIFHGILKPYNKYLKKVINEVSKENVKLAYYDIRYEKRVIAKNNKWHLDGGYFRTIVNIFGDATKYSYKLPYYPNGKLNYRLIKHLPTQHTIVFTASERTKTLKVPSTYHCAPTNKTERMLAVCNYAPKNQLL